MPLLLEAFCCEHALSTFPPPPALSSPPLPTVITLETTPFLPSVPSIAMASKTSTIYQNLLDDDHPPISLKDEVIESKWTNELFQTFFEGVPTPRRVGVAPIYSEGGSLCRLALAVSEKVLVLQFHAKNKGANAYKGRAILSSEVLCNPDVLVIGFDLSKLAITLFTDQNLRVLNGIDVQSICGSGREPLAAIKTAAGDAVPVMDSNVEATFESSVLDPKRTIPIALQAWVAQCIPTFPGMEDAFQGATRINTHDRPELELRTLAQLDRGEQRLLFNAPETMAHEYSTMGSRNRGLQVKPNKFQNRFHKDSTTDTVAQVQKITAIDERTGLEFTFKGTVDAINGQLTGIATDVSLEGRIVKSIVTQGRDGPTLAESQRANIVRQALQGKVDLLDNPFLRYIFKRGDGDFAWPETFPTSDTTPPIIQVSTRSLNSSQQCAVEHMLTNADGDRVNIIQGPPGTGKTTVIAAFVVSAVAAGTRGIWLVAQSNIAVKNIAEKLADVGFNNWRLLVSKDFHLDWHEHIYHGINKNVISSNDFKWAHKRVQGVPVTLCTLSMLAHPKISIFTKANPMNIMVVDEASQITLGNYVFPLNTYPSIYKLCLIGDDKQLPPYGSDNDTNMKSIFEIEHLRPSIIFLDTQYRMPPLIGDVVSEVVYNGLLLSNPHHPVSHDIPCCWFVHVDDSEEKRAGTSWHNPAERAAVLKIAEKLQAEEKNYCIITPYDEQRNNLENEMKASPDLIWEDKCFNVDSFQGNEKDYVIVSLVRRGMYIVTSWGFVTSQAADTLVGHMAASWGDGAWVRPEHLIPEV
ncbi:P-loop containing nucleoside triphosphate hydrolase protein [Trametes elegans]|nr:P-loop containing nucleoside triphosphate hydrolase protein [Trametes elegans]